MDDSDKQADDDMEDEVDDPLDHQPAGLVGQVLGVKEVRTIYSQEKIEMLYINELCKLWDIPLGKRIVMEYNGSWQQIGQSGSKFRQVMGKTVRSEAFLRISDDWTKVPVNTKDDLWSSLMTRFYIPPGLDIEAIKKDTLHDMGEKLRCWRHDLKKKLRIQRGETLATVKRRMCEFLGGYNNADVDILLEKWCDPSYQDYAQHMREIQALNNTPHCTGSKSLARLSNEELITVGRAPIRAQAYIKTHRKKDGSYPNREVED
ncbi:uncharacterized protein LOC132187871 [Corylus avellana]|uniref:uncharacterized protein LOC132187871 n=1 Tax=Corylus avellana TaxID=13451 RepID=UPI00286AE39E|nr:uncharacterized protein LOC132187871 [Corylus avellana]